MISEKVYHYIPNAKEKSDECDMCHTALRALNEVAWVVSWEAVFETIKAACKAFGIQPAKVCDGAVRTQEVSHLLSTRAIDREG